MLMLFSCGSNKTESTSESESTSEEVMTTEEVEALEEQAAIADSLSTEIEESSQALDEALDQLDN